MIALEQHELMLQAVLALAQSVDATAHGRHNLAEPVPLVGSGCGRGWRTLAWGKQKL